MNKEIYIQLYDSEIQLPDTTARPEIISMLLSGKNIKRFTGNDLPDGVVVDTVYAHTLRSQSIAASLDINQNEKELIVRTLLLHDLPEVMTTLARGGDSDITAPQKEQNPELEKHIASEEFEFAVRNFTPDEFKLYNDFEESGNYLKGKIYNPHHVTDVGIYSQLIDKSDANLLLHFTLAKWATTPFYDPRKIRTARSLTYVFRQYELFHSKLAGDTLRFYEDGIQSIKQVWLNIRELGVPIPEELIPYLVDTSER